MDSDEMKALQTSSVSEAVPSELPVAPQQQQVNVGVGAQPQPQPQLARPVDEKGKKKKVKKILIFAGVGVGVLAVLILLAIMLPKIFNNNPIAGEWGCYKYSWLDNDVSDELGNKLILNNDGSFMYGSYYDIANNHFAGDVYKYSVEDEKFVDGYNYYTVEFGPTTEYIMNGVKQDVVGRQMSDIEMIMNTENDKREAIIVFEDSYLMYACVEE